MTPKEQERLRAQQRQSASRAGTASHRANRGGGLRAVVHDEARTQNERRSRQHVAADRKHYQRLVGYLPPDRAGTAANIYYFGGPRTPTEAEVESHYQRRLLAGERRMQADRFTPNEQKVRRYFDTLQGQIQEHSPVMGDLRKVAQGDFENLQTWHRVVPALVSLYESSDPDARQAAGQIMSTYSDTLEPHLRARVGNEWTDKFLHRRGEYLPEPTGPKGFLLNLLDRVNDSFQGAMHGLAAINQDPDSLDAWKHAGSTAGRGLLSAVSFLGTLGTEPGPRILHALGLRDSPTLDVDLSARRYQHEGRLYNVGAHDQNRDGWLGLREAMGVRLDEGPLTDIGVDTPIGRLDLGGLVDFGAEMTLDPLNWIGFGSGFAVKSTLRGALARVGREGFEGMEKGAARAMVENTIEKIRWGRHSDITGPEWDMLETLIRKDKIEAAELASKRVLRTQRARDALNARIGRSELIGANLESSLAERWTRESMERLHRRGRVGVGVFGHTVVPVPNLQRLRDMGLIGRWETKTFARTLPVIGEGIVRDSVKDVPGNMGWADDWVLGYDVSDPLNRQIQNTEKALRDLMADPMLASHAYIQTVLKGGDPHKYLEPLYRHLETIQDAPEAQRISAHIDRVVDELEGSLFSYISTRDLVSKQEIKDFLEAISGRDGRTLGALHRRISTKADYLPRLLASAIAHDKGARYQELAQAITDTWPLTGPRPLPADAYKLLDDADFMHDVVKYSREMFKGRSVEQIGRVFTAPATFAQRARELKYPSGFRPAAPRTGLASDIRTHETFRATFNRTSPRMIRKIRAHAEIFDDPVRTARTYRPRKVLPPSETVTNFLNNFQPRRRLRRGPLGEAVAEAIDTLGTMTRAERNIGMNDLIRRSLGDLSKAAAKAADGVTPEFLRKHGYTRGNRLYDRLVDAKSPGEKLKIIENFLLGHSDTDVAAVVLRQALESEPGFAPMIKMIDELRNMREVLNEISRKAGVSDDLLRENYLARVKNPAAIRRIEKALRARHGGSLTEAEHGVLAQLGLQWDKGRGRITETGLSSSVTQEGRLEARKFRPEIEDLSQLNEAAHDLLKKIRLDVSDLFDDNPHTATLLRANTAFKAQMKVDILHWASNTVDEAGQALAYIIRTPDDQLRFNILRNADRTRGVPFKQYREVEWPGGGRAMVHPDIAEELMNSWRFLSDPAVEGKLLQMIDRANNVWASWATVGSVASLSLGFHVRNAIGNIGNMLLVGFNTPHNFARAMRLQKLMRDAHEIMKKEAISFEDALARTKATPKDVKLIHSIRNRGIAQGGQVADIFAGAKGHETEAIFRRSHQQGMSVGRRNPLNLLEDNALLRKSRDLGTFMEDNSKIALYLDGLEKGMGPTEATKRVLLGLFDYNDLTSFEVKLRRLSRFYTFLKKNTQLWGGMILTNPGRIAVNTRIIDRWVQMWTGGEHLQEREPGLQPEGFIVPEWASVQHRYSPTLGVLVHFDSTFASFADMYDSMWGVVGTLGFLPPVGALMPEHQQQFELDERFRNMLMLFSGTPTSAVNWLFEGVTGVNTFSGFKLKNDAWNQFLRATNIFVPTVTRVEKSGQRWIEIIAGMAGKVEEEEGLEADWERAMALRIMNTMTGIQVIDLRDPVRAQRQFDAFMDELGATIGAHRRQFIEKYGEEAWENLSLDKLAEAGKIERRNRAAEVMLLYPKEEWATKLLEAGDIPPSVIKQMGLALPSGYTEKEVKERDHEWHANRIEDILRALDVYIESTGAPPLTEDDILKLTILNAGITITGLEGLGVEAYRENMHTRDRQGRAPKEVLAAEAEERLRYLGIDPVRLAEERPLLAWAERYIRDAREAGWTEQEILEGITADLSRQQRAVLQAQGVPVDNDEYRYGRLTQEQIDRRLEEVPNIDAKLDYIYLSFFGRPPTEDERFIFHYQTFLTKTEQRMLGLPEAPSVPSRRNVASEEERRMDAIARAEIAAGRVPATRDRHPTEEQRRAWERIVNTLPAPTG